MQNQRRGKKGAITSKIESLTRLVSEGGSRTRIRFLHDRLTEIYKEVCAIAEEIHRRTNDHADEEWLNAERVRYDECSAEVTDYLESRKDEAPSTESLTESWVNKHTADTVRDATIISEDDVPIDEFSNFTLDEQRQRGAMSKRHPDHPSSSEQSSYGYFGGGDVSVPSMLSSYSFGNISQSFAASAQPFQFGPSKFQQALDAQSRSRRPFDNAFGNAPTNTHLNESVFHRPSHTGGYPVPPTASEFTGPSLSSVHRPPAPRVQPICSPLHSGFSSSQQYTQSRMATSSAGSLGHVYQQQQQQQQLPQQQQQQQQ